MLPANAVLGGVWVILSRDHYDLIGVLRDQGPCLRLDVDLSAAEGVRRERMDN